MEDMEMAYDNEGEFYFDPNLDSDDQDALEQADRLEQAQHYRARQKFTAHQSQSYSSGVGRALQEAGITAEQFEQIAASNGNATAQVNEISGYLTAQNIIRGAINNQQRPRDAAGRFTSGPVSGKKPRKSAAEYRAQVAEHGKISGDSDEATAVLEALLLQP
jgi:hypothetical protein